MYEVNTTNPLGTKGVLALRFGELCKEVSFVELNFISASLKFSAFNFILINFIFFFFAIRERTETIRLKFYNLYFKLF